MPESHRDQSDIPSSLGQHNDGASSKPRGILRNKNQQSIVSLGNTTHATESDPGKFDRQAVLDNTKANAQLYSVGEAIIKKNQAELVQEVLKKNKKGGSVDDSGKGKVDANENLKNGDRLPEHLKWDEANLYLTEQEKNATMKITEPKTPYQGTIGSSEYYHDDDGEDIPPLDDDPEGGLLLGEPEVPAHHDPTLQNTRILKDEVLLKKEAEEDAQRKKAEEEEETPEEKHKRFEQMRKQHYHMKGASLHKFAQDVDIDQEEDDEDEEEEQDDEAIAQAKANALANSQM